MEISYTDYCALWSIFLMRLCTIDCKKIHFIEMVRCTRFLWLNEWSLSDKSFANFDRKKEFIKLKKRTTVLPIFWCLNARQVNSFWDYWMTESFWWNVLKGFTERFCRNHLQHEKKILQFKHRRLEIERLHCLINE